MASYAKFISNDIGGFNTDILSDGFDIDNIGGKSLLLDDVEAAKKLLRSRTPDLTKEQADMMFDSEKKLMDKEEEREKKRREKEEQKALSKEERKAISDAEKEKKRKEREERRAKRKEERKQRIKKYKELYKAKVEELKKEAKNLKQTIKNALNKLWEGFKDLIKRIFQSIVKTGAAIPGIAMVFSAPPWNIPNGIDQTMNVIENYLNIIKAIKDLQPYTEPFEKIQLVADKVSQKVIASIFSPVIKGIRAFFKPIKLMNSLITKLLNWITSFLKSKERSIFRKATRKLKKLGHLYRLWFFTPKGKLLFPPKYKRGDYFELNVSEGRDYPCYCWDEDDVEEVQGLLDSFIVGFVDDKFRNRVIAYRRKVSIEAKDLATAYGKDFGDEIDFTTFDFDSIADEFEKLDNLRLGEDPNNPTLNTTEVENEVEDSFIYDIELPDGTIIQNITEAGIQYYQQNYLLKYLNAATQSYKVAAGIV